MTTHTDRPSPYRMRHELELALDQRDELRNTVAKLRAYATALEELLGTCDVAGRPECRREAARARRKAEDARLALHLADTAASLGSRLREEKRAEFQRRSAAGREAHQ